MKLYQYINALFLLLILLTAGYGWTLFNENPQEHLDTSISFVNRPIIEFDGINAKNFLVFDFTTGMVIAERDARDIVPLASLIKIPTVFAALELHDGQEKIILTRNAISQEGDSYLRVGEQRTIEDLSQFSFITSSNDAAVALFDHDDAMADKMYDILWRSGADTWNTTSPTGLDLYDDTPTATGSAWDMMKIIQYGMQNHYDYLTQSTQSVLVINPGHSTRQLPNTNQLLPAEYDVVFSKTGYTDAAGGNLVMVIRISDGHTIGLVVLGSTFNGRFTDMQMLIDSVTHSS